MTTSSLQRLCAKSDLADGGIRRVIVPGYEPLAVCRIGEQYHAIADTCSHGLASLSEGEILEGQIICPFHGGAFDVATGKPTERPCTIAIATYPVVEDGETLFIASAQSPCAASPPASANSDGADGKDGETSAFAVGHAR